MAKKITTDARRIHPRLRLVRNGDAVVNALRSEITTTVVSTRDIAVEAKDEAAPNLCRAQRELQTLSLAAPEPARKKLGRRAHLAQQPAAKDAYVNVFVEFRRNAAGQAMASFAKEIKKRVPSKTRAEVKGIFKVKRNFVLATVPVSALKDIEENPEVAFVHPADPLKLEVPDPHAATRPSPRSIARAAGSGEGVLIGIVDVGGFDFAHPDFLDEDGKTRFVSIWDQGATRRKPPKGFDYGAEITAAQIDAALAASTGRNALPATLIERQSQQEAGSHGTHVASIAAGKSGVCPKAKIAAVVIDVPQPSDTREQRRASFSDSSRIVEAIEYLLDIGKRLDLPVSINISLGTNGGAHDGSSGVSRWIDALLATPGRSVCVAAGNAGQEKSLAEDDLGWVMGRIHTSGRIPSRGLDVDLEWTVIGNGVEDISENELEIWYGAQDRFIAMVKPPGAEDWITVEPCQFVENRRLASGTTVSIYNELYHPTNGCNYIGLYLSPNLVPDNVHGIQAGVWKVRLRGEEVRDGRFNGWIERDDPSEVGIHRGRRLFRFPSFFSAATNVDSHSINSLACGHRVIAVANLDEVGNRINITSSQGPTRDDRQKPDVAAPGTDIAAANGFAPEAGRWIRMTGTSMASPYVAGVIGLMLAANRELTAAQCLGILQRTSQPLPGRSYEWQNDAGFGAISPADAVREAKSFDRRVDVS
jgi:subtilisin family serine protease